ncbi:hypothetical protein ACFV0O_40065 [Kitasatospora sp. NPDC059577]|uniref:hypothetical protein n=1 Tax=Kitasatospora sp. NPDC059577 TaxID=3346873 RepID=UPI0036C6ABEE
MSTPRPDSAPDPGADTTVALGARPATGGGKGVAPGAGAGPDEATVRLPRGAAAEATVRLTKAEAEAGAGAGAEAEDTEAGSATFLDPRVWGSAPQSGETVTLTEPTEAEGTEETHSTTTRAESQDAEATPVAPAPALAPAPAPAPAETSVPSVSASVSASASASASAIASPEERPLAPGELRRFGPGVPPMAAAAWHGRTVPEAGQPLRPRRTWRWLVPLLLVLLALAGFLFWRQLRTPALAVTGVTVTADPASPGCAATAVVTAAVETNGGAGTLRYRWLRSDGTTSDETAQDVRSGTHHTDLVLRWSFEGQGSLQATATLQLLTPTARTAAASFTYHCGG